MYHNQSTYYIYTLQNTVTKRIYVGCTRSVKDRIHQHLKLLQVHRHSMGLMQKDYDLHGEASFKSSICFQCSNKEEASRIETFVMKILKSQDPVYGYNYKDRKGNSPLAIADRWRTVPRNWANNHRASVYVKKGILLPPVYAINSEAKL